jgi:chemotaxis protein CheC
MQSDCATGALPVLAERELEALRELATAGLGHAATALGSLIGKRVDLDAPSAAVVARPQLADRGGDPQRPVVAITLDFTGGESGRILLLLSPAAARALSELLLGGRTEGELDEAARSALSEVGNIVASACLNAIGQASGLRLLPSVPRLVQDRAGEALQRVVPTGRDPLVVLGTQLEVRGWQDLVCDLLIVPDLPARFGLPGATGV